MEESACCGENDKDGWVRVVVVEMVVMEVMMVEVEVRGEWW